VIHLEQHDVGVGVGRNTAIDAAETEFIFLLDDDQIVTPDLHLDRVYQRFIEYDLDILAVRQGDGGRPMLFSPLNEWIKPRSDFELVLCFDVSRLGRCVDGNFAEQPAEVVHQHRKRLIYTSTNEPQSR
jgi:glycosyltransferase involved in cell wall biosynthesis